MNKNLLDNDVFALRNGEVMQLHDERPIDSSNYWLAVMLRTVVFPKGYVHPVRDLDGRPVVKAAVLAALWNAVNKAWQWQPLSPGTKEYIGDYLVEQNVPQNLWYYLSFNLPCSTS